MVELYSESTVRAIAYRSIVVNSWKVTHGNNLTYQFGYVRFLIFQNRYMQKCIQGK